MKSLLLLALSTYSSLVLAQFPELEPPVFGNKLWRWSTQDFRDHNVSKVEAFTYLISNDRASLADSLRLFVHELDTVHNRIVGEYRSLRSENDFDSMKPGRMIRVYDESDQIVEVNFLSTMDSSDKQDLARDENWPQRTTTWRYAYNSNGLAANRTCEVAVLRFPEGAMDTISLKEITRTNFNYIYAEHGLSEIVFEIDSTRYYPTEYTSELPDSAICVRCVPQHTSVKQHYDDSGFLKIKEAIRKDGTLHSKSIYRYEDDGRLASRIDSSEFGLSTNPCVLFKLERKYQPGGYVEIKLLNPDFQSLGLKTLKTESFYNREGQLVESSRTNMLSGLSSLDKYSYDRFGNNTRIYRTSEFTKLTTVDELDYNSRNLLIEERIFEGDKLVRRRKYFYQ